MATRRKKPEVWFKDNQFWNLDVPTLRVRCAEAQAWRCAYCWGDIRDDCTLDHFHPRSKYGPTSYFNCVAACRTCNSTRGSMPAYKFWRKQKPKRAMRLAA